MADIFLSYAREDREKAERLARTLEGQGWSVFWDRETPVGVSWREHTENELAQSKCVVVAWSSNSVRSEWVLEEAEDGKGRRILVPVSLEADLEPPFGFRTLQALDLAAWDGGTGDRSFQRLLKGLTRLLGDPPTPTKKAATKKAPTSTAASTKEPPARKPVAKKPKVSAQGAARLADKMSGHGAPTWQQDEQLNRRVLIEAGEFLMGSLVGIGSKAEHPQHPVFLSSFYLQEHPVTNEEYRRFKRAHGFSQGHEKHPVVEVSWDEARRYAEWLGGGLPTEARWEYAARAGSTSRWSSGDDEAGLGEYAWYGEPDGGLHPVALKTPNPWQLYDMHGNVWEWVQDWYNSKEYERANDLGPGEAVENPKGPPRGRTRVQRGGDWYFDADNARSAYRDSYDPDEGLDNVGFRVAFDTARSGKKA